MQMLPFSLPIGPESTRVFCGYRLGSFSNPDFFKELGNTFMPGTPYMLAPLGLAAYVAAVLDPAPESGLPDEVALIVYSSVESYTDARQNSLQGRMYTHSHAGVFEMTRSRGQFPGPVSKPSVIDPLDRQSWYLFENKVDWQSGSIRLILIEWPSETVNFRESLRELTVSAIEHLGSVGVDQTIVVAGPNFAAIWLHGSDIRHVGVSKLLPEKSKVVRDLVAESFVLAKGTETLSISGAGAFNFRFVRDLRYFL